MKIISLWRYIDDRVRQGLEPEFVLQVAGLLGLDVHSRLALVPMPKTLKEWGAKLSTRYLATAAPSDLRRRALGLQRQGEEKAAAYVEHVRPEYEAAVFVNAIPLSMGLDEIWSINGLGEDWCKANQDNFKRIKQEIVAGQVSSIQQLYEQASQIGRLEVIPKPAKVAAPAATENRKGKDRKGYHNCDKCGRTHPNECWKCTKCGAYGHEAFRCRKDDKKSSSSGNEAEVDKCMAAGRAVEDARCLSQPHASMDETASLDGTHWLH